MERWWLDERAYAGAEHLDPAYVAGYERKAGFDPTEDVEVLRHHALGPDAVVVELGAGTGAFALAVAPHCGHVVAVDVSPAMTAALRSRVEALGVDNVTVVEAGFLSYEHLGEPADVVFTRNALHQLPDFWKAIALQRAASFLRPGGVLRLRDLIYDFPPEEADEHIEAWFAGAVTDPTSGWTAGELAEHVRHEFSTLSWILDSMLERAGFDVVERDFRRSVYGAYTCTKRHPIRKASRTGHPRPAWDLGGPVFIVVSGPPASGKSTLAPAVAAAFGLPLVSKDTIKEALMSVLPVPDVEASRQLGRAAVAAMVAVAAGAPKGAVLESNFHRSAAVEPLRQLPGPVIEVFCRCDRATAEARYRARAGSRPAGHFDAVRSAEELWSADVSEPVAGGWPVIEVDTNGPVDEAEVVRAVRSHAATR